MRPKKLDPPEKVKIRRKDDSSDEYAEVTRKSFDNYYSQNGWRIVTDAEVADEEARAEKAAALEALPEDVESHEGLFNNGGELDPDDDQGGSK